MNKWLYEWSKIWVAQKSWIKSNRIPYWICFFLFSSIASQILDTICYTYIIGMWCDIILVTVSVIFAWKQYRKLDMVLQWSIVDLRVNGDIELLDRHVRMKRRFNRIFTTIWIGVSFELVAFFIDNVFRTTHILLHSYNHLFIDISLYDDISHSHFDSFVFALVYWLEVSITLLGLLIFFVPYIGYGLCTMYVLLWRLFKGKTGYRTHFHVQLTDPLVLHWQIKKDSMFSIINYLLICFSIKFDCIFQVFLLTTFCYLWIHNSLQKHFANFTD